MSAAGHSADRNRGPSSRECRRIGHATKLHSLKSHNTHEDPRFGGPIPVTVGTFETKVRPLRGFRALPLGGGGGGYHGGGVGGGVPTRDTRPYMGVPSARCDDGVPRTRRPAVPLPWASGLRSDDPVQPADGDRLDQSSGQVVAQAVAQAKPCYEASVPRATWAVCILFAKPPSDILSPFSQAATFAL